jgi:hypothetical protein
MEKVALSSQILEKLPDEVRLYIAYLEHQLAELKAQLNQNSQSGYISTAQAEMNVSKGSFGPNLTSLVATLHGRYRLSMRKMVVLAEVLWQLPLALGSVAEMCEKASAALEASCAQRWCFIFRLVEAGPC